MKQFIVLKDLKKLKALSTHLLLGVVCLLLIVSAYADNTINSAEVIQNTLKGLPNCLHYKIIGVCFWLRCDFWGCSIEVTPKVDHYLPDAVVSAYTQPTNNPWWFAQHVEDPGFYKIAKVTFKKITHFELGSGDAHDNSQLDLNNKFHEVDIIGNPTLSVISRVGVLLPSAASAYHPYYSSLLDAYAWRFPAAERYYPGSLTPGLDEIGTFLLHDWGPLYPRTGYVNQPNDAKAAAVDAMRASTIVGRTAQPHVYNPLSNDCGAHCTIYPIKINSKDAQFQMIYPKAEDQCVVFGGSDITSLDPWESDAATQGHDRYIWVLWRHYRGCIPDGGARYLGSVDF